MFGSAAKTTETSRKKCPQTEVKTEVTSVHGLWNDTLVWSSGSDGNVSTVMKLEEKLEQKVRKLEAGVTSGQSGDGFLV